MRDPTPVRLVRRVTLGAALAVLAGLAVACGDSPPSPTPTPSPTAAAGAAAETPAAPVAVPEGHAPFSAQIEQKFKAGEGPRITGTVALDPQFAAEAAGHPLLLILRSKEGRGMPIAVLNVEAPVFPVAFDLGCEHAPLQADDTPEILQGENKLVARVAASGSMMGGPGDIECEPVLVKAGGPPLALTLDRKRAP